MSTKIDQHFEDLKSDLHQKLQDMGSALLTEIESVIERVTVSPKDELPTETLRRDILHETPVSMLEDWYCTVEF